MRKEWIEVNDDINEDNDDRVKGFMNISKRIRQNTIITKWIVLK